MLWIAISLILPLLGVQVHHALILGIAIAVVMALLPSEIRWIPAVGKTENNFSKIILQTGVVLLGACLPFSELKALGLVGIGITLVSIVFVLLLGAGLGKN